jgi:hypothetical protein
MDYGVYTVRGERYVCESDLAVRRLPLEKSSMMVTRLSTAMSPTITRIIKEVAVISRAWDVGRIQPYNTMGIRNGGHTAAIANRRPFIVVGAPSQDVTQPRILSMSFIIIVINHSVFGPLIPGERPRTKSPGTVWSIRGALLRCLPAGSAWRISDAILHFRVRPVPVMR